MIIKKQMIGPVVTYFDPRGEQEEPCVEELVFIEGWEAYLKRQKESDNPYNGELKATWLEGWKKEKKHVNE